MVNVACIYALRPPENGRAANIHIHKTCILAAHNPEAAGSSPVSATKSVTVVDTISTTVTFYLFPFWGYFWKETGDIPYIFGHMQIAYPDLMRPQAEKTGLGKMTIVIRI